MASNPLAEALRAGRFCYVVELVASGLQREAKLLEVASRLARVPDVVAGSITSYAGGAMGHDPMRVGTAARARGLTPNVHVTCVGQDRAGLRKTLEDLQALGIENVFALTGDWPRARPGGPPPESPVFDLDSVHLVRLIDDLRRSGRPLHAAVAVSPFKYVEGDCAWQYLKLEKKVAAGADCAITQVGWDAEKFRELKRYVDERGLRTPLLGNVYVLGPRAAERMARGEPPGCWVSPELLEVVRQESRGKDGGLRARLERAARTVAVLRGLGYAGAYLGGTHDADHIAWIIRRARELASRWEELAGELRYGLPGGFYLYGRPPDRIVVPAAGAAGPEPVPGSRRLAVPTDEEASWRRGIARVLDGLGHLFPVTRDTALRRALARLAGWADRRPAVARALERLELAVKRPLFGCRACGNCVLGHLEYVCPETCPKHLRNGPCGGTYLGRCEVVDQPCVWVGVHARARAAGRERDLQIYIPPPDRTLQGTSSWINYLLDRDSRPGSDLLARGYAEPPSSSRRNSAR
ncbi:MAG TPA: methylenetetrahydrofolate reductase C-terminal domain-containing protein [Methylomirabilota bacterium]